MIYSGKINNIKHIVASDPCYGKDVWCRYEKNDLDCKDWDVDIEIKEVSENVDGYDIEGTELHVMLHPHNVAVRIHGTSISFPSLFGTTEYTLGMDSASMSIGINDTANKILSEKEAWQPSTCLHTLTDGCFGCVMEGANTDNHEIGFIYISGYLDSDTGYSEDEILNYLKNNLEIENLTPCIAKNQTEIETFLVEADGIYVSLATWFDVDEKFGTHVNDEDGHWVDLEAKYNPHIDEVVCRYLIDTPEKIETHIYTPSIYEKDMIKELIEDYCLKEENRCALEVYELALQESILGGME